MGDARTVRAVLTMTVSPQAADAFEREWAAVAAWIQHQSGCLRQTLCRRPGTEEITYVITSDWSDRATYHRFETSERQDTATAGLRAMRTTARMDVLDIVEHKEAS
ncbi:antibiotic biosynthesis monooxygenase family protein [Streptomyces gilvus]|uniref:antibiotic biosynthesis monooxygenase family protein n=1 Tax=Streptomyces gilvus TaxID=2920937 RepID=UPI001F0E72B3|nr:antibiotic biosynthesis monooxygenase family protein [Streptomyces sp. CME 23]MCH5670846.1 antibiotic biosynthesis monooxygenase [Streptomyces sp. CME 23]